MELAVVFTAAGMLALIVKFTSFLKYISAQEWREALTQLVAWAAGVAGVWLFAASALTKGVNVNDAVTIGQLDTGGKFILGLAIGSAGSLLYDFKKARDGTDSAAEPPLGGNNTTP